MASDNTKLVAAAGGATFLIVAAISIVLLSSGGDDENIIQLPTFSRRISSCSVVGDPGGRNETEFRQACQMQGKRIPINPEKEPYNLSEVILWTLADGNTIKTIQLEEEEGQECYIFDRLERVLATEEIAKQRWKAVRLKQKFDRNRYQNFSGSYSDQNHFIAKGGSEKEIYVPADEGADTGLFSAVLQAYKNHWVLRTTPDDWFLPVIRRIAQFVDDNAMKPEVQNYLGTSRFKMDLKVEFERGFEEMFEELSSQVEKNLLTSAYVQVFEANFSTTTNTDRLVSRLILMSSVQKYFNFDTYIACGIPEIELMGTEADWIELIKKFKDIRKVLAPISEPLGNITGYIDSIVLPVAEKLLSTYQGNVDKEWWNNIVLRQENVEQVCTKLRKMVERWDGWLVEYLNGESGKEMRDIASGLLTVPLQVENRLFNLTYPATLVAGQIGFSLYEEEVTVVKPYAGWAMLITQETDSNNRRSIMETIRKRKEERRRIQEARRRGGYS